MISRIQLFACRTHQIDVHLGMAERTVAAVARHHPLGAFLRRDLGNQVDAPVLVHQARAVLEAHVAVVLLLEHLHTHTTINKSPRLHFTPGFITHSGPLCAPRRLACPVCVLVVRFACGSSLDAELARTAALPDSDRIARSWAAGSWNNLRQAICKYCSVERKIRGFCDGKLFVTEVSHTGSARLRSAGRTEWRGDYRTGCALEDWVCPLNALIVCSLLWTDVRPATTPRNQHKHGWFARFYADSRPYGQQCCQVRGD